VTQPEPAPPTQVRHPRRTSWRTLVQVSLGVLSILPWIIAGYHLDKTVLGAQIIAVSTATARVMALPEVNAFIERWASWLAPAPRQP
jgi:hypothetical protein